MINECCLHLGLQGREEFRYMIKLKDPRMLTSKEFHHAFASFVFSS